MQIHLCVVVSGATAEVDESCDACDLGTSANCVPYLIKHMSIIMYHFQILILTAHESSTPIRLHHQQ